ncbi:hypothetical protein WJ36_27805 [Burkholderia ubonensis]|nr:hypothetical protein WJ36_27805 [Burkholderia ubonensis]
MAVIRHVARQRNWFAIFIDQLFQFDSHGIVWNMDHIAPDLDLSQRDAWDGRDSRRFADVVKDHG